MKISARLALMFALLSLVPLGVSGALMYVRFTEGLQQAALGSLRTLAEHKRARFEQWVDDNVRTIRQLARQPAIRTYAESIIEFERAGIGQEYFREQLREDYLQPTIEDDRDISELFLLDAGNGRKLSSSDPLREGRYHAAEAYFQYGRQRTWVQPISYPLSLDRAAMTVATPVFGEGSTVVAVLGGHLDLDAVANVFQQGFDSSRTLDSYLINSLGAFVTSPRFNGLEMGRRAIRTNGVDRCIGGETGSAGYADYRGVPVLGAFVWMERWKLCLLVEMNEAEAMELAVELRDFVLVLLLGMALVLAVLIGFVSRRISHPIIRMVEATEEIGHGNLNVRLPRRGNDEITRLIDGFNRMAENLGNVTASRDELDSEVAERERAVRSLEESERRLNTLMSNLPGMAYQCTNTTDWDMIFVSEGCKALTGLDASAFTGSDGQSYAELIHPNDRARVWEAVQRAVTDRDHFEFEYRIRHADGGWRWVWEKGQVVSAPGVEPEVLEGFVNDITERRRLARELQQAQKMELLGQVTGGVAHDFNNLLGVILGYSGLAATHLQGDDENIRRYLEHINRAGERARDIVAQMLAFSRGESAEDEVVDVRTLLEEEIGMLRSTLPTTIGLDVVLDDDIPPVELQPGQLNQMLMNLCINARDAMNSKGVIALRLAHHRDFSGECTVTRQRFTGEFVELAVGDTGPGLPPEQVDKIFDPFFTTKSPGKGSGLGLAVVNGIVRSHRGYIIVESTPEEITWFRLFLPVTAPVEAEQPPVDTGHAAHPLGGGSRIMIVDDEHSLAEYIAEFLESYDFETTAFSSSEEALKAFAHDPEGFDLLITDQTMPGLSGLELIEKVRNIRPQLPVVLCTGFSEFVNAESAREGDIGFLAKPIRPELLLQQVTDRIGLSTSKLP